MHHAHLYQNHPSSLATHPAPPASPHPSRFGLQRSDTAGLLERPSFSLRGAPSAGEGGGGGEEITEKNLEKNHNDNP